MIMKLHFRKNKTSYISNLHRKFKTYISTGYAYFIKYLLQFTGNVRRRAVIAKMEKADIILASPGIKRLSFIALFYRIILKSRYVHSMLYLGEGKIIHTTSRHGVVISKLPRKIYDKNRYTIFRVDHLSEQDREVVIRKALKWQHKKLDHAGLITNIPSKILGLQKPFFRWEKNRIWCSKLVYKSFLAINIELIANEKSENITSEDLSHSPLLKPI